jgi:hypothetical protein
MRIESNGLCHTMVVNHVGVVVVVLNRSPPIS